MPAKLKNIITLALFVIAFSWLLSACSSEENLLNSNDGQFRLLFLDNTAIDNLKLIKLPEGNLVYDDLLSLLASIHVADSITKIKYNQYKLYLLAPKSHKIYIINADLSRGLSVIDFNDTGAEPTDICFPNSTDAYVCHENNSTVSLVDLEFNQIARTIPVGEKPAAIACSGNLIFTACALSNAVYVIESNTHKVEKVIPTKPYPCLAEVSADGSKLAVVCAGDNKFIASGTPTEAYYQLYDVATQSLVNERMLGTSQTMALEQFPNGIAVSPRNWAFISTSTHLFRIDVTGANYISIAGKGEYYNPYYNVWRDEIMVLKSSASGTSIISADPSNGSKLFESLINSKIITGFPIK
jgi:YVTN family beta-propeller protein